jgi:hypothetical protein
MAGAQRYVLVVQGVFDGVLASADGKNPDPAAGAAPRECGAYAAAAAPPPAPIVLSDAAAAAATAGAGAAVSPSSVTVQELASPPPNATEEPSKLLPLLSPSPSPSLAATDNASAATDNASAANPVSTLLEGMGAKTGANGSGSPDLNAILVGNMLQTSPSPAVSPEVSPSPAASTAASPAAASPSPSPDASPSLTPPGRRLAEAPTGLQQRQRIGAPKAEQEAAAGGTPAAAAAAAAVVAAARRAAALCRQKLSALGGADIAALLPGGRRGGAAVVLLAASAAALLVAAALFALAAAARAPAQYDPLPASRPPSKRSLSSLFSRASSATACSRPGSVLFSSQPGMEDGSPRASDAGSLDAPRGRRGDQDAGPRGRKAAAPSLAGGQPLKGSSEHLLHIPSAGSLFGSSDAAVAAVAAGLPQCYHHLAGYRFDSGAGSEAAGHQPLSRQRSISEVQLDVGRYALLAASHSAPICADDPRAAVTDGRLRPPLQRLPHSFCVAGGLGAQHPPRRHLDGPGQ